MTPPNFDRSTPEKLNLRQPEAFQQLYAQSYLAVFRYIFGLCGGPVEEAEDLTAETFTRAWKSRSRFEGSQRAALGWLFKIARNLVIDTHRRRQTTGQFQNTDLLLLPANDPNPEDQTQLREQVQILWSLLPKLSDQHREILVLRYMLDWPVKQIGEYLEIKENTVSVYIRRALERLRQDWPGINQNDG